MATTTISPLNPTLDTPPRRRRWIPVSLRMFVVILILLGSGIAELNLALPKLNVTR